MSTKSPEQIKIELKDAIPVHFHKGDPEPRLTPFNYHALEDLHADALALIHQLETDNHQLLTKVEQLQAERDAAVAELAKCTASHCPFCKNYKNPDRADVCYTCRYGIHKSFEWHGVQKEGRL